MRRLLYNLAADKYKGLAWFPVKVSLFMLSLAYGIIIRILAAFYLVFRQRLACKVISVGNITLGGTGKTPVVEFIARYLKQQGHKVAILTRGYKKKNSKFKIQNSNYENMGDEPYMLAKNLKEIPVIVDAKRIRGAHKAINLGVDTVILDDGFQQWRLKKDLEIVTINAAGPFGNRHMIPRGILREPLSGLKRADIFILAKKNPASSTVDAQNSLKELNPSAPIFESIYKPAGFYRIDNPNESFNIEALRDKPVALFSGIADPDSFENLIKGMGIEIAESFRYPDHYNYTQLDLDRIFKSSREKAICAVITTEKDSARLNSLQLTAYSLQLLVLRIKVKIQDEDGFRDRLLRVYSI